MTTPDDSDREAVAAIIEDAPVSDPHEAVTVAGARSAADAVLDALRGRGWRGPGEGVLVPLSDEVSNHIRSRAEAVLAEVFDESRAARQPQPAVVTDEMVLAALKAWTDPAGAGASGHRMRAAIAAALGAQKTVTVTDEMVKAASDVLIPWSVLTLESIRKAIAAALEVKP